MIRVKFDRIGRSRDVDDLEIPPNGAHPRTGDQIADDIHSYAGRFLCSREFEISVWPDGTGSIDGGRFGNFTWAAEQ